MTWEPAAPHDAFYARPDECRCPNCGCPLTMYEIFACRIRGLATPVCLGCLVDALVFMKKWLLPTLETALKTLEGRGERG